jgi:hypothetical protein
MIRVDRKDGITMIEMPQMRLKTNLINRHKYNVLRKKLMLDIEYLIKVLEKCRKNRR